MSVPTPDDVREMRDRFIRQLCDDPETQAIMRQLHAKVRVYAAASGLEIGDEGQADRAENEIEEFENDCLYQIAELFVVVFAGEKPRMKLVRDPDGDYFSTGG